MTLLPGAGAKAANLTASAAWRDAAWICVRDAVPRIFDRHATSVWRCKLKPMNPVLKAPGTTRLKLKYCQLASSFAFKRNLSPYSWVWVAEFEARRQGHTADRRDLVHNMVRTLDCTIRPRRRWSA